MFYTDAVGNIEMTYKSKILNETFIINDKNVVVFESGIEYNSYEIAKLKRETSETVKKIHLIRKIFEL